jgi:hypothetical protein
VETKDAGSFMRHKLISRLEDIPGVASVSLDLEDIESGIKVKLDNDADEDEVLEKVRELLVAYGVRSHDHPTLQIGQSHFGRVSVDIGVAIEVAQIPGGARVEVVGQSVRSFRVVPATPDAIAQGMSDAWCQVLGRIPVEVTRVTQEGGSLKVIVTDGQRERIGTGDLTYGWTYALASAVGKAIGVLDVETGAKIRF